MASDSPICIVCNMNEVEKPKLKIFMPETWETFCNAEKIFLMTDQFSIITKEIISTDQSESNYYYSHCLSRFSAVKR